MCVGNLAPLRNTQITKPVGAWDILERRKVSSIHRSNDSGLDVTSSHLLPRVTATTSDELGKSAVSAAATHFQLSRP